MCIYEQCFVGYELIECLCFVDQDIEGKVFDEVVIVEVFVVDVGFDYVCIDLLKFNVEFIEVKMLCFFVLCYCMLLFDMVQGWLCVVCVNFYDIEVIDFFCCFVGINIEFVVVFELDILCVIMEFYGFCQLVCCVECDFVVGVDFGNFEQFVYFKDENEIELSDQYIVNVVEFMFQYVFDMCVSDIYIELKCGESFICFCIDGVLYDIQMMFCVVYCVVVS